MDSNQRPHRCERCALTKHLYCCTGTTAQLPTYRLTIMMDVFFTRLNRFRTTGNNGGRPFFARLICFRTTDKFGGIPCRICIAILIHIEDRHDDLVHITSDIPCQRVSRKTGIAGINMHHLNTNTISSEAALQIPPAFS